MALLDLFKKKRKEPKAPTAKTPEVQAASETEAAGPALAAPTTATVLKHFHVSEKASRGIEQNQYTFIVAAHATKTQVRDAVQRSYNVKVDSVNIVNLPAKERRVGQRIGASAARRKAIVILKPGSTIAAAQP
jgi:large subunit ribosomal protein L23